MMARIASADFTGDAIVNFQDYSILAEEWQKQGSPLRADLIDDDCIDEQDLPAPAILSSYQPPGYCLLLYRRLPKYPFEQNTVVLGNVCFLKGTIMSK